MLVRVESAIHAMKGFLDDDESDGILLKDADNAFNRVNRGVVLWNIQYICPAMKHILINFYRAPTRIFMNGEGFFEFFSRRYNVRVPACNGNVRTGARATLKTPSTLL